jgi:hypothetical protein
MNLTNAIGILCITLVPLLSAYVYFMVFGRTISAPMRIFIGCGAFVQIALILLAFLSLLFRNVRDFVNHFLLGSAASAALTFSVMAITTFGAGWLAWKVNNNLERFNIGIQIIGIALILTAILEVVLMIYGLIVVNNLSRW